MYLPPHFEESRVEVLHDLVRAYPLATIVTLSTDGLNANHIPLQLSQGPGEFGTLRGHVARCNPLLRDLARSAETLAVFHGPQRYVSPSWYPTKHEHGRAVPTWNYAVVHAYGSLRAVDDPAWLRSLLASLTGEQEAPFAAPWSVSDAPPEFIDQTMGAIVGIEMVVTKLIGKWKVSQNQPAQNQIGVATGLRELGAVSGAPEMAALVEKASQKNLQA